MAPIAVDSSTISHLDYNPETQTCTVRFHNSGNRYNYSPMTEDEYKAFLAGEGSTPPSVGKHFATRIRNNGRFKVTPLGAEPIPGQTTNSMLVNDEELKNLPPEVQATATPAGQQFRITRPHTKDENDDDAKLAVA